MLHSRGFIRVPTTPGFYITAVIGDVEETAGPLTGQAMLNCFSLGQDSVTYDTTVLLSMFAATLVAIALVMAFVLRENR